MQNTNKKKSAAPIYTVALIWLLFSLWRPITTLARLIWVIALSVIGHTIVKGVIGDKDKETGEAAKPEEAASAQTGQKPEEPKYAPEVQAVLDEGKKAYDALEQLYYSIPELAVKKKVKEIMEISDKIAQDAIDDPSDVAQIRKFQDYYLPTTIKLLTAYDRMGAQGIEGQNISGTMQSIDSMLDTAIEAYKKMLDSLFANQAMDIETDIDVMNTLLRREGFSADSEGGLKF